jgi:hypothetical protein
MTASNAMKNPSFMSLSFVRWITSQPSSVRREAIVRAAHDGANNVHAVGTIERAMSEAGSGPHYAEFTTQRSDFGAGRECKAAN